jgi:hypothetical protein
MTFKYDNNGKIVGAEDDFLPGPSPLGQLMNQDFEELPEEPAPARKRFFDPEAAAAMPQFRTISVEDLDNLPDPEWIVDGILPADAMTTIFGAPGSTKSFFALGLACAIASGAPYNGAQVKKGKVIYCVGEGLRGLKWRIEAWKLANPDADLDALNTNLIVLPRAVMLLDKTEAGMLANTAELFNDDSDTPLRAFVIDTWARSLTGGDENSAQDVGNAIHVCESVRSKTGASPIIIHHTGADGTRERGSTALRGATDTTIQMAHDEVGGVVTVTCKKMKDGEPFAPIRYSLKQFGHSVVLSPTAGPGYLTGEKRDKDYYIRRAVERQNNPFL